MALALPSSSSKQAPPSLSIAASADLVLPRRLSVTSPWSRKVHLGRRTCSLGTSWGGRSRRRGMQIAAALPQDEEQDEDEDEDEEGEDVQEEERPAGRIERFFKGTEHLFDDPEESKEAVEYALDVIEKLFEDEEPSEGMKELLQLIESAPVIKEPPPRFQLPRVVEEGLIVAGIFVFGFVVAHIGAVADEYYFARKAEKEALEMKTKRQQPKKQQLPAFVDKGAVIVQEWRLRLTHLTQERTQIIVERVRLLLQKLGLQN